MLHVTTRVHTASYLIDSVALVDLPGRPGRKALRCATAGEHTVLRQVPHVSAIPLADSAFHSLPLAVEVEAHHFPKKLYVAQYEVLVKREHDL